MDEYAVGKQSPVFEVGGRVGRRWVTGCQVSEQRPCFRERLPGRGRLVGTDAVEFCPYRTGCRGESTE